SKCGRFARSFGLGGKIDGTDWADKADEIDWEDRRGKIACKAFSKSLILDAIYGFIPCSAPLN
uniref:peptide ABC transporter n=1 Tax=Segatella buccae TaxID=28126 RepID=UPI001955478F